MSPVPALPSVLTLGGSSSLPGELRDTEVPPAPRVPCLSFPQSPHPSIPALQPREPQKTQKHGKCSFTLKCLGTWTWFSFSALLHVREHSAVTGRLEMLSQSQQLSPDSFPFPNVASCCQYCPVALQQNVHSDFI